MSTPAEWSERIELLQRQLTRERAARFEAETIAERGTRELWEANRELDARVAERTEALQRSLEVAKTAVQAKESFLAHLGNGLASPLHGALGNLELIDARSLSDPDAARLVTAQSSLRRLSAVLEGLLLLAAAEGVSPSDELSMGEPDEFLEQLDRQWRRVLAARGQLLYTEREGAAEAVVADWHRLERVAEVLLENVRVHAVPGKVVAVLAVRDGMVQLSVVDSGPGIPEEVRDNVLEPFFRLDAEAGSAKGGAGIGLAVAKRLVESGGGSLEISGDAGRTHVTVTLPVERRQRPRS